jgi:ethanolamine ammonia-lyase large subunit
MWSFFQTLGVIGADGRPGKNFGRPDQVYLQYRKRRQDTRPDAEILTEARRKMQQVRERGVELTEGHGEHIWDLEPDAEKKLRTLYADARQCIWAELPPSFDPHFGEAVPMRTLSKDRKDYVLHPPTGEQLSPPAQATLAQLATSYKGAYDVQIVISDGLNALSLTDDGHLEPYLQTLRTKLTESGLRLAPRTIVVRNGRVRTGYRIGEGLFGKLSDRRSRRVIVHVIGERPGSGHHAYSVYFTAVPVQTWGETGKVDHNLTRVISGIADTALHPTRAADETVRILSQL